MRDECLNMHQFHSVAEACVRLSAFRQHYNHERPHSRLSYLTPLEFKTAWFEAPRNDQFPAASRPPERLGVVGVPPLLQSPFHVLGPIPEGTKRLRMTRP